MTFVPTSLEFAPARARPLSPIDTIVVTAAMPITTPSTVSPARILFLARARRAIRTVYDVHGVPRSRFNFHYH